MVQVTVAMSLTNRVLALMPPGSTIDSTLIRKPKPAIGFLVVQKVDLANKTVFLFLYIFFKFY
jgi:hypothetical protein